MTSFKYILHFAAVAFLCAIPNCATLTILDLARGGLGTVQYASEVQNFVLIEGKPGVAIKTHEEFNGAETHNCCIRNVILKRDGKEKLVANLADRAPDNIVTSPLPDLTPAAGMPPRLYLSDAIAIESTERPETRERVFYFDAARTDSNLKPEDLESALGYNGHVLIRLQNGQAYAVNVDSRADLPQGFLTREQLDAFLGARARDSRRDEADCATDRVNGTSRCQTNAELYWPQRIVTPSPAEADSSCTGLSVNLSIARVQRRLRDSRTRADLSPSHSA